MPFTRVLRRALPLALLSGLAVGTTALATVLVVPTASAAGHPTNAGKVYRWGNSQWHDGFTEPLWRSWHVNRPKQVRNQHGMLTIEAGRRPHTTSATLTGHARRYGRWETRVRANQYSTGHTPYRVVAELIPTAGARYHCGARNIVLASYKLGAHRAHMSVRTLPDDKFSASLRRNLGPGHFHTYAVEVTKSHVSWFVDAQVRRTERRPAVTSGIKYRVRFRLVATPGKQMNPGRMQMDWIRYYTLERRNARSIDAPRLHRSTYGHAC
ncbi:MAG TPA: hypothetical protein VFJ19_00100 [Nocardioidaceae bacterium]|nr:hypothetical protein [Nocardioidaceae bacterium]